MNRVTYHVVFGVLQIGQSFLVAKYLIGLDRFILEQTAVLHENIALVQELNQLSRGSLVGARHFKKHCWHYLRA